MINVVEDAIDDNGQTIFMSGTPKQEDKTSISIRFQHIGIVNEFRKQFVSAQYFI